ncbi:aminoglycoside phosphotransferase family protein [Phytohabitans sp. ZYX-F-186]|uniref:Aminoglycoside phosphotransferase family protein n=1 Tax=Phytohabitans maris TaxID=3071409 RepID=A0ABU0ZRP2_9ACTN|nr:aminoglycoside phosphotransferase family protein [Phytohabitans sp. ZYX-F-186]MDQ7909655.1 aminoglycoside phosphotransferase family protein [Phytohabitans sp. ZYX-F-186]
MGAALPAALVRNVSGVWGADGRRWLDELPALRAEVARAWELRLGEPYRLSYHWVAPAIRADGTAAVLKLGLPGADHLPVEAATLRCWAGAGAVRLLAYEPAWGALLLERAAPGTPASALVPRRDTEATAAILAVMRRLHAAAVPDGGLPGLETRGAAFAAHLLAYPGDHPLPRHLVERASRLFDELCASAPARVVLHGDLHHDNVLRAEREPWLAIDPHGVVGDPGHEAGAMVYNPDPDRREDGLLALLPARVEQLADGMGLPVERVVAWAFVTAVLSEVWNAEDGGEVGTRALDVALALLPRL